MGSSQFFTDVFGFVEKNQIKINIFIMFNLKCNLWGPGVPGRSQGIPEVSPQGSQGESPKGLPGASRTPMGLKADGHPRGPRAPGQHVRKRGQGD